MFTQCRGENGIGGAIRLGLGGTSGVILRRNRFLGNRSEGLGAAGGAVSLRLIDQGTTAVVEDCEFLDNEADADPAGFLGARGGGLDLRLRDGALPARVVRSRFHDNAARTDGLEEPARGGALYVEVEDERRLTLDRLEIDDNTPGREQLALVGTGFSETLLVNSLVRNGGHDSQAGVGASLSGSSELTVNHLTVVGNGSGVRVEEVSGSPSTAVTNSILFQNSVDLDVPAGADLRNNLTG